MAATLMASCQAVRSARARWPLEFGFLFACRASARGRRSRLLRFRPPAFCSSRVLGGVHDYVREQGAWLRPPRGDGRRHDAAETWAMPQVITHIKFSEGTWIWNFFELLRNCRMVSVASVCPHKKCWLRFLGDAAPRHTYVVITQSNADENCIRQCGRETRRMRR